MTRINKYLAEHYPITRKQADNLITQKKVFVNGQLAQIGQAIGNTDKVEITELEKLAQYKYFILNKPKGIATLKSTPNERDIYSIVKLPFKTFPVGRLDKMSSGLILLTNDGRLGDKLLNPNNSHQKEYIVTTDKTVNSEHIKRLSKGLMLEGGYKTKKATVVQSNDKEFHITLTEGKKHQIRRMCAKLGLQVVKLERVRINTLKLEDFALQSGDFAQITGDVLTEFLNTINFRQKPPERIAKQSFFI